MDAFTQVVDALTRAQISSIPFFGASGVGAGAALRGQAADAESAAPRQLQDAQLITFIIVAAITVAGVAACMIYNVLEDRRFQEKQDYMLRPRPGRDENEVEGEIPDQERNPEVVVAPMSRQGRNSQAGERNSEHVQVYAENLLFLDHAPTRGT